MKVGEYVVCIDNTNQEYLILEKLYKILAFDIDRVYISDGDQSTYYYTRRFISLTEFRKKKLIKLTTNIF